MDRENTEKNMNQYLSLFLLALVEIFGDFSLKEFANTGRSHALVIGSGWYGLVVYFLIQSLRGSTVLFVNGAWDALSGILESLAAFFILGERFQRVSQYLGLGLIFTGIFLLR